MEVENIKAMLAHKYNEDKADYPAYIQPKLDGVRCLFTAKGAFSRANNQFMNVDHITKDLKPVFNRYPNLILDGELYNHGLKDDFEKIISLVKKKKPTDADRAEAAELVQYHMYDVASMTIATYVDRNLFLLAEPSFRNSSILDVTSTRLATDFDDAQRFHAKNLKLGYEGSIYRTPSGKYKALANMLNNIHDYIGQYATFTYFERTKAGSYRHPHYKAIRNYE